MLAREIVENFLRDANEAFPGGTSEYPLALTVGEALLDYLKHRRP